MPYGLSKQTSSTAIPIIPVEEDHYKDWRQQQAPTWRRWLDNLGFEAQTGKTCLVPDDQHNIAAVIIGCSTAFDPWIIAELPRTLPAGDYTLQAHWDGQQMQQARTGLGFSLLPVQSL